MLSRALDVHLYRPRMTDRTSSIVSPAATRPGRSGEYAEYEPQTPHYAACEAHAGGGVRRGAARSA